MIGTFEFSTGILKMVDTSDVDQKTDKLYWCGNFFSTKSKDLVADLLLGGRNLPNILNRLDGQFAIAAATSKENTLFLARDPFGIIPLYYYKVKNRVVFGTQINGILDLTKDRAHLNVNVLHEYFAFRYVSGKQSLFKGINQVPLGYIIRFDRKGKITAVRYNTKENSGEGYNDAKRCKNSFKEKFISSFRRNTFDKNEKKIGVLSSGGIDSSIILSCAAKVLPKGFSTYFVGNEGYKHNRIDDVEYLGRLYNTRHQNFLCSGYSFSERLIDTIRINEEPLNHPSSVLRYYLNQKIESDDKVLLSGEGADCLYCGYYIFDLLRYGYLKNPVRSLTRLLADSLPFSLIPNRYHRKLSRICNVFTMSPKRFSVYYNELISLHPEKVRHILKAPFPNEFASTYENAFVGNKPNQILDVVLSIYQGEYLVEALKTITKIAKACGFEYRHPFIDRELVNVFNSFPWNKKIGFFRRKRHVVTLGRTMLPKAFFSKSKEGFGVPLHNWFRDNDGLGRFVQLLRDRRTRERGLFDRGYLECILKQHENGYLPEREYETILWPIINLELWHRIFLDIEPIGY